MAQITWTHPSVVRLLEDGSAADPVQWIEEQSRRLALTAMEQGWDGPPYDAFELADALGIEVVARQDLEDARLVSTDGRPRIEFNPQRRRARIRFSVAHEIGHSLFDDYADRARYRDTEEHRGDDWQLEMLCNVAAAELLMPAGALPISEAANLDLVRLLDQRAVFGVSTEALLRRVVRLTDEPVCLFAAAREGDDPVFRVDYSVASRSWKAPVRSGDRVTETVMSVCTAVGYSDAATEAWSGEEVRVQAVGVPPYPGSKYPRIVGLLQPTSDLEVDRDHGIRYVRGDATEPRASNQRAIIAHVVNDEARNWSGRGFARALADRFPNARSNYEEWARTELNLGAIHLQAVNEDLLIASLVAQKGYGPLQSGNSRLRLQALRSCLDQLAAIAADRGAAVHMPLIGTGQAGMAWPKVRDLILEEVSNLLVDVTVYVLPDAPMPSEAVNDEQLTLI